MSVAVSKAAPGGLSLPSPAFGRRLFDAVGQHVRNVLPLIFMLVLIFGVWQLICSSAGSALPSPTKIWADSRELIMHPWYDRGGLDKGLGWHLMASLGRVAIGFSLSASIVPSLGDIYESEVEHGAGGITVHLRIEGGAFAKLKEKRRNLTGRTGCGLCGTEDLDQVLRPLPQVQGKHALSPAAVRRALEDLKQHQPINRETGATHAAAWCDHEGRVLAVFEDVGRHNALDKLIGFMAGEKMDAAAGFLAMTSRASVELVQKAASFGMPALVAISAPTALAVRTAESCGMILLAFARGAEFVAYANAGKLADI